MQEELFTPAVYRFYRIRPISDEDTLCRVRGLWLAVLQRALQDYVRTADSEDPEEQEEFEETDAWLHSEEEHLGSFLSVCGHLDIDPGKILNYLGNISEDGLRSLRKAGLADVQ